MLVNHAEAYSDASLCAYNAMLGFLLRTERNEGLSGGYYDEYERNLDEAVVLETREQIESEAR